MDKAENKGFYGGLAHREIERLVLGLDRLELDRDRVDRLGLLLDGRLLVKRKLLVLLVQ